MKRPRNFRSADPVAYLTTRLCERFDVVDVEPIQARGDARLEVVMRKKLAEGGCGCRKAFRDADAGARKLSDHLAKRGVLSAYRLDVVHSQLIEWNDVCRLAHCSPIAPRRLAAAREDAILSC